MPLRQAHPADASSLAAMSIEVWVGTYLRNGVSAVFADFALETFTPAKLAGQINDTAQTLIVSENGDGLDGYVRIAPDTPGPVAGCGDTEIATLYVQPRHHGKGIGKTLLAAAFEECRRLGLPSVWLTTNSENAPAIAFYGALGFRKLGTTDFMIDGQGYANDVFGIDL